MAGITVIKQWERLIILRFGKFTEVRGPGFRWVWPFINAGTRKLDLRERFITIPSQTAITKDNAPIDVDFLIYFRIMAENPEKSVVEVQDFVGAAQGIAMTTLRSVIGDISLDDVLAKREQINQVLRVKMDEVTVRWGVKITSVEIKEIIPPKEVQVAMNRQMAAERDRRATVTEAEGKRTASITVAEGEKQAAILKAEGDRQAAILRAEARRQQQILEAEGYSEALARIFSVAQTIDQKTMGLQYLDTLKSLGASPATKFIFPMEFTNLLGSFRNMMGGAGNSQQGDKQA
ncbi:MAG: SPFH/Band 7/PHB domain protein [Chloroflexi bacterium]|nr:SPFH/Band 7/PHB domain protein [Chloroflexota bacterium]